MTLRSFHWPPAMVALLVILTASALSWNALRHVRAQMWARSSDRSALERSSALEPGNADVLHKLARIQLFSDQNPTVAIRTLERAIDLNSHSAWYWLDLATARTIAGDSEGQRGALEHASALDPRTPLIAWEAATVFLVNGETERALDRLRVVVENDPIRAREALRLAWRATQSVEKVESHCLPSSASAYLAFIDVLLTGENTREAMHAWDSMRSRRLQPEPTQVGRFMEYLVVGGHADEALKVWRDLTGDQASLAAGSDGTLTLVDPSFEDEPLTGGFRWRIQAHPSVNISYDDSVSKTGTRSIRLDFSGTGMQRPGIEQYIPVVPGSRYEVTSAIKTDDLRTMHSPRWYIQDAYSHELLAKSDEWGSPVAWRDVSVAFRAGLTTKLVALRVVRDEPAFPIRGHVWIDDIRMVKR